VEGRQRKNSFLKIGKDKLIVEEASLETGCDTNKVFVKKRFINLFSQTSRKVLKKPQPQ
jgi:hypothetical protein